MESLEVDDRLSELPDSLLEEILSLLPTRDAVRTTILSKRWKDVWSMTPSLRFWEEQRHVFIDDALTQWRASNILKFKLGYLYVEPPPAYVLDSWLLFVVDNQVKDLTLDFGFFIIKNTFRYCLPQPVYACSSITKLTLAFVEMKIDDGTHVQWSQLKSLTIEGPPAVTSEALGRIISGAPVLEELYLCIRRIEEKFIIRSSSLKKLAIGRHDWGSTGFVSVNAVLMVSAPNLSILEINGVLYGACLLDVPSLTCAVLRIYGRWGRLNQVFRNIAHAHSLTLSYPFIEFLLHTKKDTKACFSNAKFLELYASKAEEMLGVVEMFPNLKTLIFRLDEENYVESDALTMSSPRLVQLKRVEISWCLCDPSIFPALEILLQKAPFVDNMVFRLNWLHSFAKYRLSPRCTCDST